MASKTPTPKRIKLIDFAAGRVWSDGGIYITRLAPERSCTCWGFKRWGRCYHFAFLATYLEATLDTAAHTSRGGQLAPAGIR